MTDLPTWKVLLLFVMGVVVVPVIMFLEWKRKREALKAMTLGGRLLAESIASNAVKRTGLGDR